MAVEVPPDVVEELTSGRMPSPLIRTDFSDDDGWNELLRRARRPYPPDDFQASLQPLSDRRLEGLAGDDLAALGDRLRTVYLADAYAMRVDDPTVLVVDPRQTPVATFRVALPALATVENNLSIANVDFDEFARSVDEDGVFRGAEPSHRVRSAFARPLPELPAARIDAGPEVSVSDGVGATVLRIERIEPNAESARRTLEDMRRRVTAEHQPHLDRLRAAYPTSPEYDERAAVMVVLLETLPAAEVVALFRLLYDEPGGAVHRQVELITEGASVDPDVLGAARDLLRRAGWPAE